MKRREFGFLALPLLAPSLAFSSMEAGGLLGKAAAYLASRQGEDGAWRSEVYGAFRDGRALTPLVTLALLESRLESAAPSVEKACAWLKEFGMAAVEVFPVHNASWLLSAAAAEPRLGSLRGALVEKLLSLQLGPRHRWQPGDPPFGGWAYSPIPAARSSELPPFQQPNLSATVLAVEGLRAGGLDPANSAFSDALRLISSCQHPENQGGFFQTLDDPVRNKAGITKQDGIPRAYTSATADGWRGLLHCGRTPLDPRAQAARAWLDRHADIDDVADLRFYAAASLGRISRLDSGWKKSRESLSRMGAAQESNGSFLNPAPEMRENDPLVATSLAIMALANLAG